MSVAADLLPPQDLGAEQAVLGRCLLGPEGYVAAKAGKIGPEDFYAEAHRIIWRAIEQVALSHHLWVDVVLVEAQLKETMENERVGGREYLDRLAQLGYWAIKATEHHVRLIKRLANQRKVIVLSHELEEAAYRGEADPETSIERLQALIVREEERRGVAPLEHRLDSLITHVLEQVDLDNTIQGLRLGLPKLDLHYGGWSREVLVMVKAETGFGKTTLLRQAALETARATRGGNGRVLVYLLEDTAEHWLLGALAWCGGIDYKHLRAGSEAKRSKRMRDEIQDAWTRLTDIRQNLFLTDELRTFAEIRADVLAQKALGAHIEAVIIDYAQLVQVPGNSAYDSYVKLASAFMDLHAETGIPILTASQVTRQESGAIRARGAPEFENAASALLQLERGDGKSKKPNPDELRRSEKGTLRVVKKRQGSIPNATNLFMDMGKARIRELDTRDDPESSHDNY